MFFLPGMEVLLKSWGKEYPIREDGYIGALPPGSRMELEIRTKREGFLVFHVNTEGDDFPVMSAVNLARRENESSIIRGLFRKSIPIVYPKKGKRVPITYPDKNNIRIFDSETMSVYTLAVVSQKGNGFVTFEKTFEFEPGLNEKKEAVIFHSREWPLLVFMIEIFVEKPAQLRPKEPPSYISDSGLVGVVEFWDSPRGVGGVWIQFGDKWKVIMASVHWTKIVREDGSKRIFLQPGETIKFKDVVSRRPGPHPSEFKYELTGVRAGIA